MFASQTIMKLDDHITEARIRRFKPFPGLIEPLRLIDNFDASRITIYWPSRYGWGMTQKWLTPILNEFRRHFKVVFKPIPHYDGAVVIEVGIDGQVYPVAIDRFDLVQVNHECAANMTIYFKMQFALAGYREKNIVPGGFIPARSSAYLNLKRLRQLRDHQDFSFDVYGRFGKRFAKILRGQAVDLLCEQTVFAYQGGLGRVSYQESLEEVSRSKVCVDLPGQGPLCFRLIDYLAVGACVVAYPHQARLPVPLEHGKHIVYCREDMSDLVDLCRYYCDHAAEREAIAQNARSYFDRYLCRPQLASYYINAILALTGHVSSQSPLVGQIQ